MTVKSHKSFLTLASFVVLAVVHSDLWGMGWLLAERKQVTSGSFHGFAIGSTKRMAAENLAKLGARDLMAIPLPHDLVVAVHEPADVRRFVEAKNGIRLTDLQGLEVQLFFDGGQIDKVESRGIANTQLEFLKGQPKGRAVEQLVRLLSKHPGARVESIGRVDSAYWGTLNRTGRAAEVLSGYDGWHFIAMEEGPSGATYRLFFVDDRLLRLEYDRPRFRK